MRFIYKDMKDEGSIVENLTLQDVRMMIEEHNEEFGTDYRSIADFNFGEQFKMFLEHTKAVAVQMYLEENGYNAKRMGDLVWVTIWTDDLECSMQVMVDLEDPQWNEI